MCLQRRCTFMREMSWLLHWEILIYWHVGDIELWYASQYNAWLCSLSINESHMCSCRLKNERTTT